MFEIGNSSPTLLKICGVCDADGLQLCETFKVDYVGLNLIPTSPRFIDPDTLRKLLDQIEHCKAVLIVAQPERESLLSLCRDLPKISAVQCHGSENPEEITWFEESLAPLGVEVWKAVTVHDSLSLEKCSIWKSRCMRLILDGATPGRGRPFDWNQLLPGFVWDGNWGVAGGITVENVSKILEFGPGMIDVATGSEIRDRPGRKDPEKIARFCEILRS